MGRILTILAVAVPVTGLLTGPLAPAAHAAGNWQPSPTAPFAISGVCSFTMKGDIVKDAVEVRTDSTYPDGSPEVQDFRGPLAIRFTNESNGRSAVRHLNGYARLHYLEDGGRAYDWHGGGSVPVRVDGPGFPRGWYVLHGRFEVVGHVDGTRLFSDVHAKVENLCLTLA